MAKMISGFVGLVLNSAGILPASCLLTTATKRMRETRSGLRRPRMRAVGDEGDGSR